MKRKLLCGAVAILAVWLAANRLDAGRGGGKSPRVPRTDVAVSPVSEEDYAYGSMATRIVELTLRVPSSAELWFNGKKAELQTGIVRPFATPELEPGWDYSYDIRVRWLQNGREVEQTRHVIVRAGDRVTLIFAAAPNDAK